MKRNLSRIIVLCALVVAATFSADISGACSVFRVIAKDGTIISGRTMEFGFDMQYSLMLVPRGKEFTSPAPDGGTGLNWKARYGYVANNVLGIEQVITDGLNEEGLAYSGLWYETDTKWQQIGPGEKKTALAHVMFGSWVLGNFATVEELKKGIGKVKVFGLYIPQMKMAMPLHAAIQDAKGGSVVVEYENGEARVYDNPIGVMTNAPNFPYMVTNLRNYIGMSPTKLEAKEFGGVKLDPTGHGSVMWWLPGDITPPSRFVRLAVMTRFAEQQDNGEKALNLAQHIVSAIHIMKGMVVDRAADGKIIASETTQWSSYRDLTNRVFYFRTYDNFNMRKIDLKKLDFTSFTLKSTPMYGDVEVIKDLTDRLR